MKKNISVIAMSVLTAVSGHVFALDNWKSETDIYLEQFNGQGKDYDFLYDGCWEHLEKKGYSGHSIHNRCAPAVDEFIVDNPPAEAEMVELTAVDFINQVKGKSYGGVSYDQNGLYLHCMAEAKKQAEAMDPGWWNSNPRIEDNWANECYEASVEAANNSDANNNPAPVPINDHGSSGTYQVTIEHVEGVFPTQRGLKAYWKLINIGDDVVINEIKINRGKCKATLYPRARVVNNALTNYRTFVDAGDSVSLPYKLEYSEEAVFEFDYHQCRNVIDVELVTNVGNINFNHR